MSASANILQETQVLAVRLPLVDGVRRETLRRRICAPGEHLYRNGQPFRAVMVVETGSFKVCDLTEDGRERVTSFKLRGDCLGVESIDLTRYACDAIALEPSSCWEISYAALLQAAAQSPGVQADLNAALAREIRSGASWMMALATLAADSRVAAFLLDMGHRCGGAGCVTAHFALRMSRMDMASFLGLKHETISRSLAHLAERRYIRVCRRNVDVLDPRGLAQCASMSVS
ncbi:MAG: Crp/Fnr family transcriptional regulator [Luteibacter sp.]